MSCEGDMDGSFFVYYWLIFAALVPVFSGVVFFLSRKAGFFKDQDRLRYLALWAEVPDEAENAESKPGNTLSHTKPQRHEERPKGN
jgi:hypothetical protein